MKSKNLKKWFINELKDKEIDFNSLSYQEKMDNITSIFFNRSDLIEYFDSDCLMRTIKVSFEIIDCDELTLLDLIVYSQNALNRIGLKTNIEDVLDAYYKDEYEYLERKALREKKENNKLKGV